MGVISVLVYWLSSNPIRLTYTAAAESNPDWTP